MLFGGVGGQERKQNEYIDLIAYNLECGRRCRDVRASWAPNVSSRVVTSPAVREMLIICPRRLLYYRRLMVECVVVGPARFLNGFLESRAVGRGWALQIA